MGAEKSRRTDKHSRLKDGDLLDEIRFTHWGTVPSKSNFRKGGHDWRKGWKNIKTFQEAVAYLALHAGARPLYRKMAVEVEAVLIHQRLDVDNAGKAILDGLEGFATKTTRRSFVGRYRRRTTPTPRTPGSR